MKWFIRLVLLVSSFIAVMLAIIYLYIAFLFGGGVPKVITFPQGFTGLAMIIWDQPQGMPAEYENETLVLNVPPDGVLITQAKNPYGRIADYFWYRDETGNRTQKIQFNQGCINKLEGNPIIVCSLGTFGISGGELVPFQQSFVIGRQDEWQSLAEGYIDWARAIFVELHR